MALANLSHPGWTTFAYLSIMPGGGSLSTVRLELCNQIFPIMYPEQEGSLQLPAYYQRAGHAKAYF